MLKKFKSKKKNDANGSTSGNQTTNGNAVPSPAIGDTTDTPEKDTVNAHRNVSSGSIQASGLSKVESNASRKPSLLKKTITNASHHQPTTPGNTGKPSSSSKLRIIKPNFTVDQEYDLENTVTSIVDPQLPFGDGKDKLFGLENYGYTCYVNSIFQCLYHIDELRENIMKFPERDLKKHRKRKFRLEGKNPTPFEKSLINGQQANQQSASTAIANSVSGSGNTSTSPQNSTFKSIFSRSTTEIESPASPSTAASDYTLSSFRKAHDSNQDKALEKTLNRKYPNLKALEINYSLNTQSNLTLVGILNDPKATLEWRKKAAMIKGPIINLDESLCEDYDMTDDNLYTVLKDCFECIAENFSVTGVLSPLNLINIIKRDNILFRNLQHQDAHEFLNFLINNLYDCLKVHNKENIIGDIFQGELTSETKCLTCDNLSYRDEKFFDLSIDLEPDSSISNCLNIFSKVEILNKDNKFYCEECYSYQEASKTIKLKKVPKILTFHLKRFKYSEKLGRLVKLFYRVEYVKTLRIFNTTKDSVKDKFYELYGVVIHIGSGPYHGHYISIVKTELYGWLLFDDETIEKIDEDYVYKFFGDGSGLSTAYLLFYKEIADENDYLNSELYNGLSDDE